MLMSNTRFYENKKSRRSNQGFWEKFVKKRCVTYREILYLWLDANKDKWKESTYSKYRHVIECHVLPEVQDTFIERVDADYINDILRKKSCDGRLDGEGGLSPTYIRLIAFVMQTAQSFAAQNEYCEPLKGEIHLPSKNKKMKHVLSVREQQKLENSFPDNMNDKDLGILLSLYTGMRIGEVCGLKWSDIDFENQTIHVRRTVERIAVHDPQEKSSKTKLVLMDTKSFSSNRIIPIPSKISNILIGRNSSNGFLLTGRMNEYMDPRTLQYYFHKTLKSCGICRVNFHALRHTFATRCMESGMDMKSLSELLGHANVSITLGIYVHSTLEHKRKQLEAMSKLFDE